MTKAARRAAESLLQEVEAKVAVIPCSPVERDEIHAALALGIGTLNQRRAIEFAITDQGRALDRDSEAYLENVQDSLGMVIGHKQLWDELGKVGSLR